METVGQFIAFALEILLWYIAFAVIFNIIRLHQNKKDEIVDETVKKISELIHRVKVEQHGDVYYWFDADNDQFLCQGKTEEEAVNHLKSRFSGHIFFLVDKEHQYKLAASTGWKRELFNLGKPQNG